eukprot:CAMPEP_0113936124 /NCGR_PEP_ID=MMETSP1339-20121228/3090_1 /TAXON_ID=94617 /ORGANISM="Fibrocapsa japonica" /LENGTH=895 /DNA_ID=CAMNT_0000938473 /DNA_START=132 /DNA_END=2819 /DNA_ORIENTATION=+ /assembly_acc=CAM_ASM_000762
MQSGGWMAQSGFVLAMLAIASATVSVVNRQPVIYDTVTPKLRIEGTGFMEAGSGPPTLKFIPGLTAGLDYGFDVASDTMLVLELRKGKRWANLGSQDQATLYMSEVSFEDGTNHLMSPVAVATVVPTPVIRESSAEIYHSATPMLTINGTGLAKIHRMEFTPPLKQDEDYTLMIRSSQQLLLSKKPGKVWRSDPGPLVLKRIDTGGGLLQLNPPAGGVTVAEVQADLDAHGITVIPSSQPIYQSTPEFTVDGTGFGSAGMSFRFSNSITNFTVQVMGTEAATLKLKPGAQWRKQVEKLPGPLTMLAAKHQGAGWVPLGATAAKRGRSVAVVFEDPVILPSSAQHFNTHSHHITVSGKGFVKNINVVPYNYQMRMEMDPPLQMSQDYTVTVLNRTAMVLELGAQKSWCLTSTSCSLKVKAIDTGAGMVNQDVVVAVIGEDDAVHESGLSVARSTDIIYQSAHYKPLSVYGSGFVDNMNLIFYPPIQKNTDYDMSFISESEIVLTLIEGQKWMPAAGPLILMSVQVTESSKPIYAGLTQQLTFDGIGFEGGFGVSDFQIVVNLDPTPASDYEVLAKSEKLVLLGLKEGKKWADVPAGETVPIKVVSIDSGAGEEQYNPPVQIAVAQADPSEDEDAHPGQCDDSCIYAFDGECDDPENDHVDHGFEWGEDDDYFYDYDDSDLYGDDYDFYYAGGGYGYYGYDTLNYIAACDPGTDCTDCGGFGVTEATECDNTCRFSRDDYCDDPRGNDLCNMGTDCQDCGPVGADNFTAHWDTTWFDDDDDYFYMPGDYEPYEDLDAEAASAAVVKSVQPDSSELPADDVGSGGSSFMSIITAVACVIGAGVIVAGAVLGFRQLRSGQSLPYLPVNRQAEEGGVEMGDSVPLTPDVVTIGGGTTHRD